MQCGDPVPAEPAQSSRRRPKQSNGRAKSRPKLRSTSSEFAIPAWASPTSGESRSTARTSELARRQWAFVSVIARFDDQGTPPRLMRPSAQPPPVRVFDSREVYRKHVDGKRLVYLDTNLWIHLAWGDPVEAADCREECRRAHGDGKVLFPLSYAAVSELFGQQRSVHQRRRAELMDELSEGVCLRSEKLAIHVEAAAALPVLLGASPTEPDRSEMFTYIASRFGDLTLVNQSHAPAEVVYRAAEYWRTHPSARSLCWHLDHGKVDGVRRDHAAKDAEHLRLLAEGHRKASESVRNANGSLNFERALRNERVYVFQHSVWPSLEKLLRGSLPGPLFDALVAHVAGRGGLGRKGLRKLFDSMPSTDLYFELYARRSMNPTRNTEGGDFWDIEHARLAPAYTHAFASTDRELVAALRSSEIPRRRGCEILGGISELRAWLRSSQNAPVQAPA